MDFFESRNYVGSRSDFFALTIDQEKQKIAFLGIDSGGRQPMRKQSYPVIKPGLGGYCIPAKKSLKNFRHTERTTSADFDNGTVGYDWNNEKVITFDSKLNKPIKGRFYELNLDIETAPPTIWADRIGALPKYKNPNDCAYGNVWAYNTYKMPIIIHFPDYGRVMIEATGDAEMTCKEEICMDMSMKGLCLGDRNIGHHARMMACHYGYAKLTFLLKNPAKNPGLKITVLDEFYPKVAGCDMSDPMWNGLKRTFLNSFTLERTTLSMGDNIGLSGVAHLSMHHKADLLSFLNQDMENGCNIRNVCEKSVCKTFEHYQAEDGEINWDYNKPKKVRMTAFIDTTPSAMISLAQIATWKPSIGKKYYKKALKAADFLMSLDSDDDGIIEVTFHGNSFSDDGLTEPRQRNWWDNFAFGHKDGYFNMLCHRAMRLTAELARKNGDISGAEKVEKFLAKCNANFHKAFFNPATGVYAGWISQDGKVHDYMFTFVTAMAILEKVCPIEVGKPMLKRLIKQMDKMGFGDLRYGIPGPTMPVPLGVDTYDWAFMGEWPRYENGGLCGMNGFYFLQAMYTCGMHKEADKIFKTILNTYENEPTHSGLMPGYMKSVDWRTKDGNMCGYNYLADNYFFLLAAYTGHFGIPTAAECNSKPKRK